jgi:hypothetical protein
MNTLTKTVDIMMKFYSALFDGDVNDIKAMFAGEPLLNEPSKGQIQGERAFDHFIGNYRQWMRCRNPRVECIDSIAAKNRAVEEYILHLHYKGESIDLPVAIIADLEGDKFTHIRIYHSMWPLFQLHIIREPILPRSETLQLPPLIDKYMKRLSSGDTETIITLFEKEAYVREPSGASFIHAGQDALNKFYKTVLAEGGIPLEHCTCTYDGTKCAVEYNIRKWGKSDIPPQAGIAVYEQGISGRLSAVRIYDDVTPPFEMA